MPESFQGYVREFERKFFAREDLTIASGKKPGRDGYEHMVGDGLDGDYIFEVPVQDEPVPPDALEVLNGLDITLRDVEGKEHN